MSSHKVKEFSSEHMPDCLLMAKRMALAVVHHLYDEVMGDSGMCLADLEKLSEALEVLERVTNIEAKSSVIATKLAFQSNGVHK